MKKGLFILATALVVVISGCGNTANNGNEASNTPNNAASSMNHSEMEHENMTSEVPEGLKEAANPEYKVGDQVIITEGHMAGMKGATATIVGAYDTNVYAVSYTPTTGGDPVTNHKWVIQQDLKDAGDQLYAPGTEVVLNVDHMPGMKGATATVDTGEQTTVYMVDYTPTTGGEPVRNHKWVTGDELKAK
ncbi:MULTISPECIES: YdhK family protein [Paenibacillus]|uniref:DUF1541 domain-containing protein n=3 Tax=Paenibacillus TaxID=44249 RepID=A0A5J5GEL8_9BACL|nr:MULTISPECIES: YdhK family protein [Paenibacillus]KAA9006203.1 DUF1541 domain-containing protein [Paenibacillus spiritus]KUP24708.1 hypothetical protein AWJ19_17830 [Paenibacillus sp. DMB5]QSF47551.1 YdhK family protein [Paenibacillus tianjinensis]SDJ06183.1 Protein of unknown function [Paenibacillus typhae]